MKLDEPIIAYFDRITANAVVSCAKQSSQVFLTFTLFVRVKMSEETAAMLALFVEQFIIETAGWRGAHVRFPTVSKEGV